MSRRPSHGIALLTIVTIVIFQPALLSAGEPSFYNLEEIPEAKIGGVSFWDGERWNTARIETIDGNKGGRYACGDRDSITKWLDQLVKIRSRLQNYEQWLDNMYIVAGAAIRKYRQQYDAAVMSKDSNAQQAALKSWKDAENGRDNISKAKEETQSRLKMLEKQRAEKAADFSRICGGCAPSPGVLGQCR